MPTPLRLFIYACLLAAGLVVGRYVLPATRSILDRGGDAALVEAARQDFWQGKVDEVLAAATKPEQKVARLATTLDRVKPEEFPAVLNAAKGDEALLSLISASWADVDPAGFFKYLAAQSEHSEREMKLAAMLISRWAQRDFRAAEAAASRLRAPGAEPDPFRALALAQLRSDVRKGWDYLQKQNLTLPDAMMLQEMDVTNLKAARWQGLDVPARMEWLQSLPRSPWQSVALAKLSELWLQQSPVAILKEAQAVGKGMGFVPAAAAAWVKQNPTAAQEYFSVEAKGQVKAALGLALAQHLATEDPQAAWDFALTSLAGEPRVQVQEMIVSQVVDADPTAAWQWLRDLPDSAWRTRVLVKLQTAWKAKDPAQASEWWGLLKPSDQAAIKASSAGNP